ASMSTSAWPYWWNLNPNDNDGTPEGRLDRHKRFLAAVAVKTSTNRKGIAISAYTTNEHGVRNQLDSCEDVTTAPGGPASVPATPCEEFVACPTREVGPTRDCGW